VEGFAELMNDKARNLGLRGTHFENPNGLDSPGHYSTARDLAVLAAYAMENPVFRKTVSTKQLMMGQRSLTNHNKLLWRVEGADGVKTGYTKAAGRILVSSATRNNRRILAVTIDAPDDWTDHRMLLEEGFAKFHSRRIIRAGDCIGVLEVESGQGHVVELIAMEDFSYALTEKEEVTLVLPSPGFVYAPVAKGQSAGSAHLYLDDALIGRVPQIYGETVERQPEVEKGFFARLFGE
jgi:D-alanyl-D-alanine carboxypeptidase